MSTSALDHAPGTRVCLLELAGRTFAVEVSQAREVRLFDGYTVVPLAPAPLIGMTNLRGAIVPIVDLQVMLELPSRTPARTVQTLVVEADGVRVALALDSVIGIESLEASSESGALGEAAGLGRAFLRRGDEVVPLLDVAKIVESLA